MHFVITSKLGLNKIKNDIFQESVLAYTNYCRPKYVYIEVKTKSYEGVNSYANFQKIKVKHWALDGFQKYQWTNSES